MLTITKTSAAVKSSPARTAAATKTRFAITVMSDSLVS